MYPPTTRRPADEPRLGTEDFLDLACTWEADPLRRALAVREMYRRGLMTYGETREQDPTFYDVRCELAAIGRATDRPDCILPGCVRPADRGEILCRWCRPVARPGDCEGCRFPVRGDVARLEGERYHPACLVETLDEWARQIGDEPDPLPGWGELDVWDVMIWTEYQRTPCRDCGAPVATEYAYPTLAQMAGRRCQQCSAQHQWALSQGPGELEGLPL